MGARARRDDPADLPARRGLLLQRGQPRRHRQHQPHRSPLRQARQRGLDGLGAPDDSPAIGERWAMIAVLTAVTTPRITFYVSSSLCLRGDVHDGGPGAALADPEGHADGPGGAGAGGPGGQRATGSRADAYRARCSLRAPPTPPGRYGGRSPGGLVRRYGSWVPVAGRRLLRTPVPLAVRPPLKGALDWLVPRSSGRRILHRPHSRG